MRKGLLTLLLLMSSSMLLADNFELSGFIGPDVRHYWNESNSNSNDYNTEFSFIFNPEFRYKPEEANWRLTFVPFFRFATEDDERTHGDIRELYWAYRGDRTDVLVGINKIFWGVAESRHLVDIINQVDQVEDIDEEDRLGQPMINVSHLTDIGNFDFFVLPGFRPRNFSDEDGRLTGFIPIDDSSEEFESGAQEKHIDFAARYSNAFGDWDLGVSIFHGISREPRLIPNTTFTRLIPHYDTITQVSTDIQYTHEAWLWKFEALFREGHGRSFWAAVGGFEYTLYQIFESDGDLGLLMEYHKDERGTNGALVPLTTFDDDVFFGARWALNDVQDTEFLMGAIIDVRDGNTLFSFEAERRLGQHYVLSLDVRAFMNIDNRDILKPLEDDDFVQVRLARYF